MPIKTIEWINNKLRIIDQTELPLKLIFKEYSTAEEVYEAIKTLRVRGAPAIGIAGAFGLCLGIQNSKATNYSEFKIELDKIVNYLKNCRPTAINLAWAIDRLRNNAGQNQDLPIDKLINNLISEAIQIYEEDRIMCRKIGLFGVKILKNGQSVLTHCNAGGLATSDYGTALAPIYHANEIGMKIIVYADETRPLLQGARLTAWELMQTNIDVILICDNMAASLMKQGKIDSVIVGADRIAANGDTANKIGTYGLAILAQYHGIPFYVAAPSSTIDFALPIGDKIPIEERAADEITHILGKQIAPENVKVCSPAFDITPAELITGWITDKGLLKPPFTQF